MVAGLSFARVRPRPAMTIGIAASIAGALGIATADLTTMFLGQATAGIGFGAAFTAALRLIIPWPPPTRAPA